MRLSSPLLFSGFFLKGSVSQVVILVLFQQLFSDFSLFQISLFPE